MSNRGLFMVITMFLVASLMIAGCSSDKETSSLPAMPPATIETTIPTFTPSVAPWTGGTIVQTLYGAVEGFADESDTWVWKAIPFAKPPVGELR